jgi:DtxR family Mn-dependent transcriptional regulator
MPDTRKQAGLSPTLENYMEIIFRLEMNDGAAKAGAIAEAASVSRPTVTRTLKTLKKFQLIEYTPYSLIRLTDEGMRIGRDIAHRHLVFQEFFENILQLDATGAGRAACCLEHAVPPEVIRRLGQFVLYLKSRAAFWEHWQDDYLREEIVKSSHLGLIGRGGEAARNHRPSPGGERGEEAPPPGGKRE